MTDLSIPAGLLKADRPQEALKILNEIVASGNTDAEVLFLRGKTYWRLGMRDLATNDYAAAAALDPDGPASRAFENARDIAGFFNPDIFNP